MLLDANILLEWLLGQERANECGLLLEKIRDGELKGSVTDFALHTVSVIMEREGRKRELTDLFRTLSSFEGLTLMHASLEEHAVISTLAVYRGLDFDDAYQAYFARRQSVPLISFDRHFDGIVERKTPREMLG